jgi:predicted nicotinamide N-methyase
MQRVALRFNWSPHGCGASDDDDGEADGGTSAVPRRPQAESAGLSPATHDSGGAAAAVTVVAAPASSRDGPSGDAVGVDVVEVVIAEERAAAEDGAGASCLSTYAWPASFVLGQWVAQHRNLVAGCRVLELGCGVGVCGHVAASCGAASVICTDFDPRALALVAAGTSSHGPAPATASLDWEAYLPALAPPAPADGSHAAPTLLPGAPATGVFDVLLAADALFDAKLFLPFLACVATHLEAARDAGVPHPRCLTAYVVRNPLKTVAPMLAALGLAGRQLDAPTGVVWRREVHVGGGVGHAWLPVLLDCDTVALLELTLIGDK